METIKFRAWDKEEKKMVLSSDHKHKACYNFEGWDVSDICAINSLLKQEEYIFMQFTGLKDKKGKEIFEGDIVDTRYGRRVVEWDDNNSGFQPFNEVINAPDAETESEVIGNILENTDLIK